jgi:hypothetical protein
MPTPSGNKFDDMFLQNLQPGQRLNSEVTIHNVNESKFLRNQTQNLSNDIEITRIPGPTNRPFGSVMSSPSTMDDAQRQTQTPSDCSDFNMAEIELQLQKQALQLQQQLRERDQAPQEFIQVDNSIFAPNQLVNLEQLDADDRDIESFKRFDYSFDPPKNKPKVNLNVKDMMRICEIHKSPAVASKQKKPADSPSSSNSIFDGISSSVSSQSDDMFADIGLSMEAAAAAKQHIAGEINQSIISN